jgi:enoyl-CoA hydratase
MGDYTYVKYETFDEGTIVRLMLNRPQYRNAQSTGLLRDLNSAFLEAEADDAVRVVILGGLGPSFSAGHDLGTPEGRAERAQFHTTTTLGVENRWLYEWEYYLSYTERWRNLRKITIAQVQGHCLAAGLMLAWACDLIVAANNAVFADVVGTRLGMCGLEYFAHPWEFGPRKAKELLLTGDSLDAEEAYRLGMVSKIFPPDKLEEETLNFARRIAERPTITTLLIKQSVNQTQDIQGFYNALRACFSLHELNHAHWAEVTRGESALGTPAFGVPREWKPIRPADKYHSGWVEEPR